MNSTSFGHYICFVRTADGRWYGCDDAHVAPTSVTRALSQNAYMLFYQRDIPKAAPQPGYKRLKPLTPAAIVAATTAAVQKPPVQPNITANGTAAAPAEQQQQRQQQQQLQLPSGAEQLSRVSTAPAALVRMAEETGSSSSMRDEEELSSSSFSLDISRSKCSTPSSAAAAANGHMHQRSFSSSDGSSASVQHADSRAQAASLPVAEDGQQVAAAAEAGLHSPMSSCDLPALQYELSRSGPELLVVRAHLLGISSAADVSVDVLNAGPQLQRLQLKVPGRFATLDVPLAQELDGGKQLVESVSGKFYTRRQILRLNLHLRSSQQQQHIEGKPMASQAASDVVPGVVHWHSTDGAESSSGSESDGFIMPHSSIRSVMSEMDLSGFLGRHSSQGIMQDLINQQQQQDEADSSEVGMTFTAGNGDGKASRPKSGGKKSSAKKSSKGKKRR